jgi:hypothetical protein
MPPQRANARAPLLQLFGLVALATTATTALGFQLGSAQAFAQAGQTAALAGSEPGLVARAGLLAQEAASAETSPEARSHAAAELGPLLDRIEATHLALVLSAAAARDHDGDRGAPSHEEATAAAEVDSAVGTFLSDGRALIAAARDDGEEQPEYPATPEAAGTGKAAGPTEALWLTEHLERTASSYAARSQDIVRRQTVLVAAAWGLVAALSLALASTLRRPAAPAETSSETEQDRAPRYVFITPPTAAGPDPEPARPAVSREPAVSTIRANNASPPPRLTSASPTGRALVAARDEPLRAAITDRLAAVGFAVEASESPEEAREAIATRRFGLLVVDGVNIALARAFKGAADPGRAPCIAVASVSDDPRALRAGGADVVVGRPLLPLELETAAAFAIGALPAKASPKSTTSKHAA